MPIMEVDVPRRLRAARVLADLTVPQLAARLNTPGLGAKTLGAIERGTRTIRPHELRPIAEALDVPESFFTQPLGALDQPVGLKEIQEQLDRMSAWEHDAVERIMHGRSEWAGRILERLDQVLAADTGQIVDRLNRVEQGLNDALRPLAALAQQALDAEAARVLAAGPPRPGGELGRRLEAADSTAQDQQQPPTRREADVQRGSGRS